MSLMSLIPVIGPAVQKLLDLIPDPNARARAEADFNQQILTAVAEEGKDNRAVNQAEAAHMSVFVAGWRPFIGWICGLACAQEFLIRPFWIWAISVWWPASPLPPSLSPVLWELMFGMLGIGGLRTFEKIKGVNR